MDTTPNTALETQLADHLRQHGIRCQPNFRLETGGRSQIDLDFYVYFPHRAFIEIMPLFRERKVNTHHTSRVEHRLKMIADVYYRFGRQVLPILVTPFAVDQSIKDAVKHPIVFIEFAVSDPEPAEQISRAIRNNLVHSVATAPDFHLDKSNQQQISFGMLDDVAKSYEPLLTPKAFEILKHEIHEFLAEYDSKHYTTGALRIGRTVEFILYALASSWGVNINKVTVRYLAKVKNHFFELERILINYLNSSGDDKQLLRNELKLKNEQIKCLVENVDGEIEKEHNQEQSQGAPLNPNSLMRDIKRKFSGNDAIREEINIILKQDLIQNIMNKRNKAAHANTQGSSSEVTKSKLLEMIEDFRTLLFHLCNIAANVQSLSRAD